MNIGKISSIVFVLVITTYIVVSLLNGTYGDMSIKYYVEPDSKLQNYTSVYDGNLNVNEDIVKASFSEWMVLNPDLQFSQVYNKDDARIVIYWQDKVYFERMPMTVYRSDEPDTGDLIAGLTDTDGYNSIIKIDYFDVDCKGSDVFKTKDTVKNILTHEIGHALGLVHSSDESNIMYAPTAFRDFEDLGYVIPSNNEQNDLYVGEKELREYYEFIGQHYDWVTFEVCKSEK